jgi:hypothetical protein
LYVCAKFPQVIWYLILIFDMYVNERSNTYMRSQLMHVGLLRLNNAPTVTKRCLSM